MNDLIKEFFDLLKSDDVYGLTTMLDQNPELANAVNDQGTPALMVAIYYDRPDVRKLLLMNGAKIDACVAAAMGDLPRLEKCLEAGKSAVEMYSTDGWTPLHLAAYFGRKEAAKILLDAGAPVLARSTNALNNHPLHAAATGKSRDIVAMLLDHGADVNATQAAGWTPLHAAAQNGDAEMVKVLLAAGADANIRADNNQLPLDLALGRGHKPVVDLLMEAPGLQ
ncbi:MAG: ankyrin repeat domain-containing protein [Bryobacterales bacterium]|nr:ankyrin repeat domain-containing protein [Bryobacterales bacterium]